jgi:mRNA-degrading endonuclease RelE of RelBE toxin-antitoxin system
MRADDHRDAVRSPIAPANPRRLGRALHDDSARRGPYRVVYRVDDHARVVTVLVVARRRDVHRAR